jgi:hypothetical protein
MKRCQKKEPKKVSASLEQYKEIDVIWIDGILAEYEYAVSALNYDKLGHETGLGSRGVLVRTLDQFGTELAIFVGVKMDVVTITTNRFLSTFINIPSAIKRKIKKICSSPVLNTELNEEQAYTPDLDSEDVVTVFLDIHRVDIDIVELANMVYDRVSSSEEYIAIARDKIFKTGTKRTARAISATTQRTFVGNMENFGYIFTKKDEFFILNEMIVPVELVDDEIWYSIWLTPHDLREFMFLENRGMLFFEDGSEYVSNLGSELVSCVKTDRLFKYDRRGFRNGYWDITVENPVVNHGYSDGTVDVYDTVIFSRNDAGRVHKHRSVVELDSSFYEGVSPMLENLIVPEFEGSKKEIVASAFTIPLKKSILTDFMEKRPLFFEKYSNGLPVELALNTLGSLAMMILPATRDRLIEAFNNTFVSPLFSMNILHDWDSIDVEATRDSIIFMYHPILNTFVFYEVGDADTATITPNTISFISDGLRYGFEITDHKGVFTWANICKPFRVSSTNLINAAGDIVPKDYKGTAPNPVAELAINTDSMVKVYDDLIVNGSCSMVFVVRRDDVKSIVSKRLGELSGQYVLGLKTGNIKIARNGLWM